jgi:hypothetical protein
MSTFILHFARDSTHCRSIAALPARCVARQAPVYLDGLVAGSVVAVAFSMNVIAVGAAQIDVLPRIENAAWCHHSDGIAAAPCWKRVIPEPGGALSIQFRSGSLTYRMGPLTRIAVTRYLPLSEMSCSGGGFTGANHARQCLA